MDSNRNEALASLGALLQAPDPPDESAMLKIALSMPAHYLDELREVEMRMPALFIKHQALIRLLQGRGQSVSVAQLSSR